MDMEHVASRPGRLALLRDHARLHAAVTLGLGLALLGVLALLTQSITQVIGSSAAREFQLALLGGAAGFALMMMLDTTLG